MSVSSATQSAAIDQLRVDFEQRWRDGQSPQLEDVLQQLPSVLRQQGLLALLPIEMHWRHRQCRPVSGPELSQRFWADGHAVANLVEAADIGTTQWQSRAEGPDAASAPDEFSRELPTLHNPPGYLVANLRRCSVFNGLPPDSLSAIAACLQERSYLPGEVLVNQGRFLSELLIIQEGEVEVVLTDDQGRNYEINSLGPQQVLGEMSLLTQEPATASVLALRPTKVLVLPAESFHQLATREPWLSIVLTKVVASRLGKAQRDVLSGKEFSGFRILRPLATGGMSVVYEATRQNDSARVALKMMSHRLVYDEQALQLFQREAELIESFDHPHIVRMYQRFQAFHTYFIAMQFCEGQDLQVRLRGGVPLDLATAARILGQTALALAYCHRHGVVHRDIKPSNILVTPSHQAVLVDFGLAKPSIDANNLRWSGIVGTPRYMAPEQLAGQAVTERADLFSLGCVAYEVFAGYPLITEATLDQIRARHREWCVPEVKKVNGQISSRLAALIEKCLSRRPVDRVVDLEHLAEVLFNSFPTTTRSDENWSAS